MIPETFNSAQVRIAKGKLSLLTAASRNRLALTSIRQMSGTSMLKTAETEFRRLINYLAFAELSGAGAIPLRVERLRSAWPVGGLALT